MLDFCRLEFDPSASCSMRQAQRTHRQFEISNDILVMYAQNTSGEDTIPMPHQRKVGAVVTRDILDAVGDS